MMRIPFKHDIYEEANKSLRNAPNANEQSGKEPRLLLLESWVEFEKEHGIDSSFTKVQNLLPKRVKKRRKIESDDPDIDGQWEEYFDYIFPEDEGAKPNLKLLEMAKRWKKNKPEDNQLDNASIDNIADATTNSEEKTKSPVLESSSNTPIIKTHIDDEKEEDIKGMLIRESESDRLVREASDLVHIQSKQNPDADDEQMKNESSSAESSGSANSSSPSSADEGSDASDAKQHKKRLKRRRKRKNTGEEQKGSDNSDSSSSSDEDQIRSKKSRV